MLTGIGIGSYCARMICNAPACGRVGDLMVNEACNANSGGRRIDRGLAVVTANRSRTGAIILTFVPGFRNGDAELGPDRKSCEMHGSITSELGVYGTP